MSPYHWCKKKCPELFGTGAGGPHVFRSFCEHATVACTSSNVVLLLCDPRNYAYYFKPVAIFKSSRKMSKFEIVLISNMPTMYEHVHVLFFKLQSESFACRPFILIHTVYHNKCKYTTCFIMILENLLYITSTSPLKKNTRLIPRYSLQQWHTTPAMGVQSLQ